MNTGLQDAYNLAWKLALVVADQADAGLLDSYNAERRRVAQNLLRSTDRAFALLVSDSWLARLFRTRIVANVVAFAMRFTQAREAAFRTISQIGIRYRASRLSQDLATPGGERLRAGDRFPWLALKFDKDRPAQDLYRRLDDTCFNLIVIGQTLPYSPLWSNGGFMRVHAVNDDAQNDRVLARAGIAKPAYYLLRPDGHVGLAGARLEPGNIERYFDHCGIRFGPRSEHAIPAVPGAA